MFFFVYVENTECVLFDHFKSIILLSFSKMAGRVSETNPEAKIAYEERFLALLRWRGLTLFPKIIRVWLSHVIQLNNS